MDAPNSTMISLSEFMLQLETYISNLNTQLQTLNDLIESGEPRNVIDNINTVRFNLCESIREIVNHSETTQLHLTDAVLGEWYHEQTLAGNGHFLHFSQLNEIESCYQNVYNYLNRQLEILLAVQQSYIRCPGPEDDNGSEELAGIKDEIKRLQMTLIQSAFVIEQQPIQVLRTNTR